MQVPGFNEGKWIAVGDEEGFVSIINGASQLPKAFRPGDPEAPRPQAQWLAHHNAIFDLAWCQVSQPFTLLPCLSACLLWLCLHHQRASQLPNAFRPGDPEAPRPQA
jgi:hypothetical protein